MITSTIRQFTEEEKKQLTKQLPSFYSRLEGFIIKFVFAVMILLIPLLTVDHFFPVRSDIQAVYCIVVVVLALSLAYWITQKLERRISKSEFVADISSGQVEVVHVKTSRVIKREDPEDFGIAYYIAVTHNGKSKTLFLWGQYLDLLEYESIFPNTEFEFIRRKDSDEFFDFKTLGQHFKEEKTLPPFGKAIWESGSYPVNGQILDLTIDEIR